MTRPTVPGAAHRGGPMSPERVRELLGKAIDHGQGTHRLEDVLQAVARGEMRLWIAPQAVAVSEFIQFPRRRVLSIAWAGGSFRDMRAVQAGFEAYARGGGADAMMMVGRPTRRRARLLGAWARLMGDWTPAGVYLWKDL